MLQLFFCPNIPLVNNYFLLIGYYLLFGVLKLGIFNTMITKTIYKTKDYSKVKFSLSIESAEKIKILGLNNDWETGIDLVKKKDGSFVADINLPKGVSQQFRYLIDNKVWMNEPTADGELQNNFGTANSILEL